MAKGYDEFFKQTYRLGLYGEVPTLRNAFYRSLVLLCRLGQIRLVYRSVTVRGAKVVSIYVISLVVCETASCVGHPSASSAVYQRRRFLLSFILGTSSATQGADKLLPSKIPPGGFFRNPIAH